MWKFRSAATCDFYARFTPNSRGRLTYDKKTPEGHKLLLDTCNNSGLLAIEIYKFHDRF